MRFYVQRNGRAVPNFIGQALRGEPITVYGDGRQTRSFCFISDLVEASYLLMMSDYDMPMNLGNPEELTILKFAKLIKTLCESKSEIVYEQLPQDDPIRRKLDISKAKAILGWEPKVGLEEGLKRTIEYFRENIKITR